MQETGQNPVAPLVQIYRELFPPLYGFGRFRVADPQAAEDLVAQVFEWALGRLATVRQPERVRAWLFTIARNQPGPRRLGPAPAAVR